MNLVRKLHSTSGDRQTQVIKDGTLCFNCVIKKIISLSLVKKHQRERLRYEFGEKKV
jgi:hypothetical protein